MSKALIQTLTHMRRVQELLGGAAKKLIQRGIDHDKSKLTPEELGPLDALLTHQEVHGQAAFGTPEYGQQKEQFLTPMLQHHYQNNTHHPEYYGALGVNGMDLYDVLEMFYDWRAASERSGQDGMSLTAAAERFKLSPQLLQIMRNTADNENINHD